MRKTPPRRPVASLAIPLLCAAAGLLASPAQAYVGPGAGFALHLGIGQFFLCLLHIGLHLLGLLHQVCDITFHL